MYCTRYRQNPGNPQYFSPCLDRNPYLNCNRQHNRSISHSLMPTSCPIKTNPVHKVFIDDRKQIREDVIWSRTVVKKDYIGNLFRPSKRFLAKEKKEKVVRSKRKKISVNGTMGSYDFTEKHGKEEDEGWHSLGSEADGCNMLLRRSTSAFFPKSKRGLKKHKPWGPSLQNSTPTTSIFTKIPSQTGLKTTSCSNGILSRSTKREYSVVPLNTHTHVKPTKYGIPRNPTLKNFNFYIRSSFQNKIPRPCSKAFSIIAQQIAKSNCIEASVRKKHRMHHQEKRLKKVRSDFARRYTSMTPVVKTGEKKFEAPVFDTPNWEIPFAVEGSYESPFLGTSHHTRNVTVLSPLKGKSKKTE